MITDFHSHILPNFDDGAADTGVSIQMLEKSSSMGVETIVSTSHCYPVSAADIDEFIIKRETAYNELKAAMAGREQTLPGLVRGCEAHLTCDLTKLRGYKRMCIDGTNYMLVEMPASPWTDKTIDNIYKLSISGVKPIIAHAERNLGQKQELLSSLYMLDVLIQINAESFGVPQLKKFIDSMMKNKMIHLIGTDMHNMRGRCPNMDNAQRYIKKRYGSDCWDYLMHNAEIILSGEELSYRKLRSFVKNHFFR